MSSKACPVWKCSASSLLSGRFLISKRCFPNLFPRSFPVCPTYRRSHFLHLTTYMTFFVLQFPPSFSSTVIFFFVLVTLGFLHIFLQSMQEPHSEVDEAFFSAGRMSFRIRWLLMVFGLRKATVGTSWNTLPNLSSD